MENNKQESVLVEFEYNGHKISFSLGNENIMVNATEMAKPFGKRVKDWLKTDSINEFIQVLENQQRENNPTADNQLIRVVNGGLSKRGTWIHEDLALVFAQKLSPDFAVWVDSKIEELQKQLEEQALKTVLFDSIEALTSIERTDDHNTIDNQVKEESLIVFKYNGHNITFNSGNEKIMVNATEMAKLFGKRPVDWLRFQQSQDFINKLSKVRILTLTDLVKVTRGGTNPGTWMHEDVAIEFARWLNPEFAIWCNDHMKELFIKGFTKLDSVSNQKVIEDLQKQLEEQAHKVVLADAIEDSDSLMMINGLAKILNQNGIDIGANRLFQWMRDNKYLCRRGNLSNYPTQTSMNKGLFKITESQVEMSNGCVKIVETTKLTGKGQKHFVNIFLKNKNHEKVNV